jgi:hypothetical protein
MSTHHVLSGALAGFEPWPGALAAGLGTAGLGLGAGALAAGALGAAV